MLTWLFLGFAFFQAPKVVPVRIDQAAYERMGLQVAPFNDGFALLGGYQYQGRKCLREVSVLDGDGRERVTGIKLAAGRNHFRVMPLDASHVLVIGGYSEIYGSLAEVESIDLRNGRVEAWPWLAHEAELFSTVRLGDKIFIIGGLKSQGVTKTFGDIQSVNLKTKENAACSQRLATSRFGHDSVWVPKVGKLLIAGGKHVDEEKDLASKPVYRELSSLEWFDPYDQSVSSAGEMTVPRDRPKLWALDDGTALIIGGSSPQGKLSSIELYDPATQVSKVIAQMSVARMAATVLPYKDRGIIIAGGWVDDAEKGKLIEYFDFATQRVTTIGAASSSRAEGVMLWLRPDEEFILAGGKDSFGARDPHGYAFRTTEIFRVED